MIELFLIYTKKNHFLFCLCETATENLQINQIFDCGVAERDGKHYVNVKSVRTKAKFDGFSLKFERYAGLPIITKMINHAINANWRIITLENEMHFANVLGEIGQAILTPVLSKMAIQDFFQGKCE